jgi:hypothetical protein
MILVYDTPHYKAGHNGGIIASIMHSGIANTMMWQGIIKKGEWVRVT